MRVLFTFENPLPNSQADAEVFVTTAKYLAPFCTQSWLHVPSPDDTSFAAAGALSGMEVIRASAPSWPAAFRHLCCGLTLPLRRAFRQADLVYTRNLWIARLALLFGQRVVFDHYRPWPDQVPPLQWWIYRLFAHRRLVLNICHSQYTRSRYIDLGVPADKLYCIHNGFEPERLQAPIPAQVAKTRIGLDPTRKTVIYTGRINHKKGLGVVIAAARRLPDHDFILVGSSGDGPIEASAKGVSNLRIVPWQTSDTLAQYLFAADVLLIPPSRQPLAAFGTTVLPLKVFLYLASGRPIIAGDTSDVREVLRHGENAFLCSADDPDALVRAIRTVTSDARLSERLGATALADSRDFTWSARAHRIAAVIAERLRCAPAAPEKWSRAHFRAWVGQSWRWLVHLVRNRSWVLPSRAAVAAAPLPSVEHE